MIDEGIEVCTSNDVMPGILVTNLSGLESTRNIPVQVDLNNISDGDYFNWKAPDEPTTSKYRALDRTKTIAYPGLATITVTFTEIFQP